MSDPVTEFLASHDPTVRAVAERAVALVRALSPEAREMVNLGHKTISYGRGERMADQFCYVAPLRSSVNLGFFAGTELPDPGHLLRGTGKRLRHVKLTAPEQVDAPAIRALLLAAIARGRADATDDAGG